MALGCGSTLHTCDCDPAPLLAAGAPSDRHLDQDASQTRLPGRSEAVRQTPELSGGIIDFLQGQDCPGVPQEEELGGVSASTDTPSTIRRSMIVK